MIRDLSNTTKLIGRSTKSTDRKPWGGLEPGRPAVTAHTPCTPDCSGRLGTGGPHRCTGRIQGPTAQRMNNDCFNLTLWWTLSASTLSASGV